MTGERECGGGYKLHVQEKIKVNSNLGRRLMIRRSKKENKRGRAKEGRGYEQLTPRR